jgi:hypothetical protein
MADPQWDGHVLEVWDDGDTFTAELSREGDLSLIAEFSMSQCGITVQEGDLLIITPRSVAKRDLGVWTQAEVDAIMRRARKRARQLRRLAE